MIPLFLAALVSVLPYAPTLVYQSAEEIQTTGAQFDTSADVELDKFIQRSKASDYTTAYQIWSDLLFRYVSFRLKLAKTTELSPHDSVKAAVKSEEKRSEDVLQKKLNDYPGLLNTFLENAKDSAHLTPQERLFTENILKEYLETNPQEEAEITKCLDLLATEKKEPFCRALGSKPPLKPESLTEVKIFTANVICFPGSLAYLFGGICPWRNRIDRLAEIIRKTDAEIVCLQEVWDPHAMRAMMERLKNDYSFFIYNAGDPAGTHSVEKMGYSSGLLLASKLPLESVAFFKFPRSLPETSNRGAILFTCRAAQDTLSVITTHLQHGDTPDMKQVRQEHLFFCYALLQESISRGSAGNSWGCLAGDLNIDGFLPEFHECGLDRLFDIPYMKHLSKKTATCTDYFNDLVATPLDKRDQVPFSYELLDYCIKPALSLMTLPSEQKLIPLHDLKKPTEALSDHQGLLTTWKLPHPFSKK